MAIAYGINAEYTDVRPYIYYYIPWRQAPIGATEKDEIDSRKIIPVPDVDLRAVPELDEARRRPSSLYVTG